MTQKCEICHRNTYGMHHHICLPKFACLDMDRDGDDWENATSVYECDTEDAAKKAALNFDTDGDGGARYRTIHVKDAAGNITKWHIRFEHDVTYYADEVE